MEPANQNPEPSRSAAAAEDEQEPQDEHARPVVLLCAAPGTQLSSIAKSLEVENEVGTWDLEEEIRKSFRSSRKEKPPGMDLVAIKDRGQLHARWEWAYGQILNKMAKTDPGLKRLISLHLTWYSPNYKEFFSPIHIPSLVNARFPVEHVVVLIDDVYDMYRRLARDGYLYDKPAMKRMVDNVLRLYDPPALADKSGIWRFVGRRKRQPELSEEARRVMHSPEAVELALTQLMGWRRSEMVKAENLARTLGCELTILGTKHTRESLNALVRDATIPRVYLSHRISELRRVNKESRSPGSQKGKWGSLAYEVNALHVRLAEQKVLLINPTAIDELRFDNDKGSPGRRSPILAERWPLPDNAENPLLWSPPKDKGKGDDEDNGDTVTEITPEMVNNETIFLGDLSSGSELASHSARSLSNQIAEEVSLRDHFIVQNTPNICVYRPFFSNDAANDAKANWSGGVLSELGHWKKNFSKDIGGSNSGPAEPSDDKSEEPLTQWAKPPEIEPQVKRIAFVHTDEEILRRLKHLTGMGAGGPPNEERQSFEGSFRTHIASSFHSICEREGHIVDVGDLFAVSPETILETGEYPQSVLAHHEEYLRAVDSAALKALHHAFAYIENPNEKCKVLLLRTEEHSEQKVTGFKSLAIAMEEFFSDGLADKALEAKNGEFMASAEKLFRGKAKVDFRWYGSRLFGIDYEQLSAKSGEDPVGSL